ncbi:PilW family protein [Bhargavaea cecembensis]|uniref:PilW family protein n=1 Tax=Bhargavaea cecembensis TaxID=394098 RepID=UPI000590CB17|nr:type II secretion system protein [Bhargavaea cecembensis]
MKRATNEKGMTLVELIAVLALVGMVVAIIMTLFSIGSKFNSVATRDVHLQQDMNLIITKLTQEHRTGECYSLQASGNRLELSVNPRKDGKVSSKAPCGDGAKQPTEIYSGAEVKVCRLPLFEEEANAPGELTECAPIEKVDPRREDLRISIQLLSDDGKEFTEETTLTRFKEVEDDGKETEVSE